MENISSTPPVESATPVSSRGAAKKRLFTYALLVIFILWLISSYLAINAFSTPLHREQIYIDNNLEIKTAFDYSGIVKPSSLYPLGGRSSTDQVMFINITEKLIINIDSSITSEKQLKLDGNCSLMYSLIAEDMWKREYKVFQSRSTNSQGLVNTLLKEDLTIDLIQLFDFIKRVEEETSVSPARYLLVIQPAIKGQVFNENGEKVYDIDNNFEIPFEISSRYIKYIGENKDKMVMDSYTVESKNIIQVYMDFFGKSLPVLTLRYVYTVSTLLLLIPVILAFKKIITDYRRKFTKIYKIERKCKERIVEVESNLVIHNHIMVELKSINKLLSIAEEKEESILKYENKEEETITYYVVTMTNVYYYQIAIGENTCKGDKLYAV